MANKPTTILVSGIGGPTPRAIARTLKKYSRYGPYHVIGLDCNKYALGLYESKYIAKSYTAPRAGSKDYWKVLKRIIRDEKIEMAIVQPEEEVKIWSSYGQNNELPCPVLLPPAELIPILCDKSKMSEILINTDFIPRTILIQRHTPQLEYLENELGYPYWLRAIEGTSGLGSLEIKNLKQAQGWLNINQGIKEFLASSFLSGRNLACKCLFKNGRLLKAACCERLTYMMNKVSPSGITGNISLGRFINSPETAEISIKCIEYICQKLGVEPHGMLTVDLKEDHEGKAKITEINVRHIATTSFFAAAGANFVEDTVLLTLCQDDKINACGIYNFPKEYFMLRDVDGEPMLLEEKNILSDNYDF